MIQVSTQAELQAALNNKEALIQLTANIPVASQINIQYDVTITSASPTEQFKLFKTSDYYSYMFRVINGGTLTLQNIILDGSIQPADNTANRSLIYVTGGSLNLLNDSSLMNNTAYSEGGGVFVSGSSSYVNSFTMTGNARITNCSSRTWGGGISLVTQNSQDHFTIEGESLITSNTAANGGGIAYRSLLEGIGGRLTLKDQVKITANTASSTGGGITFSGLRAGNSAPALLTLGGNVVFSGNHAVHGGGIYFYSANAGDSLVTSGSASVTGNTASGNGGGICFLAPLASASVSFAGLSLTDNTAGTGGALYLLADAGGSVTMSQTEISNNHSVNGASGSGGGLWIQNRSVEEELSVSMSESSVTGNNASANGGGMAVYGGPGTFRFQSSANTYSGNTAELEGGGVLINGAGAGTLDFFQDTITDNTADGSAGGLYYANLSDGLTSNLTITACTISRNIAGFTGGGLRISSGQGVLNTNITDSTIASNTARQSSGGGIWNGGDQDLLTIAGTTSVTENLTEEGNGGGIYFNSDNGTLTLKDNVKINYNHADMHSSDTGNHGGGISVVPGKVTIQDSAEIAYNSALKYGGGISLAEHSSISMNGGSIHDNHSYQSGGGVWNHDESSFTMTGGSVENNTAAYGGGFYNDLGGILIFTGGSIHGNTSTVYASGIYNDGLMYAESLRELSNGIYITNLESIIRLTAPLENGSVIQLDSSGYVTPNAEGTPIIVGAAADSYPVLTQADADAFKKPPKGFDNWIIKLSDDHTQVLLVPVTNYTVTFDGNDRCCPHAQCIPSPVTVPESTAVILPEQIPFRRGARFLSWNTDPCGKGTPYYPGENISGLTSDLTLYAIWRWCLW